MLSPSVCPLFLPQLDFPHRFMDNLQFYEGPLRNKPLAKRRKRILPSQHEVRDAESPAILMNEADEVQLQSQSELQPQLNLQSNIPRTVYIKEAGSTTLSNDLSVAFSISSDPKRSLTITHEPFSSISASVTKTAPCNKSIRREGIETGRSVGVDLAESPACGLVSSYAIEDSHSSEQGHDNVEHAAVNSALSPEAKDTESLTPCSGITFPCHESNHPLQVIRPSPYVRAALLKKVRYLLLFRYCTPSIAVNCEPSEKTQRDRGTSKSYDRWPNGNGSDYLY